MPISSPNAENSGEVFPHLQLLLGCLLLALSLCIPIVIYTDHVKRAAAMIAPILNSQASAAETFVPAKIAETGAFERDILRAQLPDAGVFLARSQNQSARVAPNSKSAPDHGSGDEFATQKLDRSKRILRKLTPAAQRRSAIPTLSRTWSRNNSPRRVKAALIAIGSRASKTTSKNHN